MSKNRFSSHDAHGIALNLRRQSKEVLFLPAFRGAEEVGMPVSGPGESEGSLPKKTINTSHACARFKSAFLPPSTSQGFRLDNHNVLDLERETASSVSYLCVCSL